MPVLPLTADDGRGLPVQERALDQLYPAGLGVLTGEISPGMVDEVIELAGCREKRRRLLSAPSFLAAPGTVGDACSAAAPGARLPQLGADQSRQRLGARPLELLFGLRRGAVAVAGTPGAFAFGRRLVAWAGPG